MNKNQSIETIDAPEFIDLYPLDINPLMSACKIKVLYLGENRNGSFINKETAIKMAKTLRGCPIVGYWREEDNDFGDHGQILTIDENGELKFNCKTVPYGFVSPVAEIWFQKFNDIDDLGNRVEREYLVTQGFLWTGQFEEANVALDGHGQSMELDSKTINGSWATNSKTGMDFFIINDATFTKLCILGDNIEPCFEGASIRSTSADFSNQQDFACTLRTMLKELNETLYSEGGLVMPENFVVTSAEETVTEAQLENEETITETSQSIESETAVEENVDVEVEESEVSQETEEQEEQLPVGEEDVQSENNTDAATVEDTAVHTEEVVAEETPAENGLEIVEEFTAQQREELEELRAFKLAYEKEFSELEELRAFKLEKENAEKDEMINKYHMLSDEDKADIIAHKTEYSLQQIEEKLALVYVKKNVDFSTIDGLPEKEDVETSFTFSLDSSVKETADAEDDLHVALRELISQ